MKRIIEISVVIKSIAALVFAGQVIVFVIIGSFFGLSSMTFSFVWQAMAIAVITAVLHYVTFTDAVIKKMRYSLRYVMFSLSLFATLAAFAIIFQWFPMNATAWLLFALIFIVVTGIMTAAFEIYSKITGRRYNESLSAYLRNK